MRVLKSGWYILGKEGLQFEESMKKSLSTDGKSGGFVGCNWGTDALILALRAAGVGSGDEVITVSHTAIPTIAAIAATGARPVFVDIDSDTWLMNLAEIKRVLSPKTKAL